MIDIVDTPSVDVQGDDRGGLIAGVGDIADIPREHLSKLRSTLLPQPAVEALESARSGLEEAARSRVGRIKAEAPVHVSGRSKDTDPRNIARWEDDGGYTPTGARRTPADQGVRAPREPGASLDEQAGSAPIETRTPTSM